MSCRKCELLLELRTPKSPRDYWVMTEIFVLLHGSDVCTKIDDVERPWLSEFSKRSDRLGYVPSLPVLAEMNR